MREIQQDLLSDRKDWHDLLWKCKHPDEYVVQKMVADPANDDVSYYGHCNLCGQDLV